MMRFVVSSIDIGDACLCQGDYYRALEHYFLVLSIYEKLDGEGHYWVKSVQDQMDLTQQISKGEKI